LTRPLAEARRDIQTKTSLLESHLVAGKPAALYETFAKAYRSFAMTEDPKGYIAARLADQAARRAKYGDTVFLQEPDIQERRRRPARLSECPLDGAGQARH